MSQVKTGTFEMELEEAIAFVKYANGRVRFQLMVHAFLPTEEGRGFEGQTCISVSRKTMVESLRGMGRTLCTDRGAKIRLHCTAGEAGGDLNFIAVY